ncbi:hypothetical protein BLNAU_5376 [Blattamonas nauphoetae]|uniref:Uncharacterized protein n=1 Tax=Blattamonas nauphoetae TaxID=2049346 RepID=A0ABQ9Y7A8_9EUKA|nr:hypothetical protein BLNAU_5376 [Blattamonas nauphoetae]
MDNIQESFDITAAETGSFTVFQLGVTYAVTTLSAGSDSRAGKPEELFVPMLPTVFLTYPAASPTSFTIKAEVSKYHYEDIILTFTPATATAEPVEVTIPFSGKKKESNATVQVSPDEMKGAFTIGETYTTSIEDFRVVGNEWTVVDPFTTTYECFFHQHDPTKKDGADDAVSINCINGMISYKLLEGDNTGKSLILTPGDAKPIILNQDTKSINFAFGKGYCHVFFGFDEAKIKNGTVGTAQIILGDTTFLAGELTFDGSKSVATVIAALLTVLALVF